MPASDQANVEARSAIWVVPLLIALVSILLWPTMPVLADKWRPGPENVLGHGWLVVAVVAWGVLSEARALPSPVASWPAWLPAAITVALSLAWALAKHAAMPVPQQLVWLMLVAACLWTVLGGAAMRMLLRPLSIMIVIMPIWALPHRFVWFAATTAVKAILGLIGVPAYFEGNLIHLASGTIEIASGCAGLSFFTTALATAGIIGYINRVTLKQQVVLLAAAAALAMVVNWLRIVIIVIEAQRTHMQTTLITKDHYAFGWILFAIALTTYCLAFARYGQTALRASPLASRRQWLKPARLGVGLACAAVGPLAVAVTLPPSATDPAQLLSPELEQFRAIAPQESRWYPNFPDADASVIMESDEATKLVYVYGNQFLNQTNARRLIADGHSILPSERWRLLSSAKRDNYADVIALDPAGSTWSLRYSYWSGRWVTANPVLAQLALGAQQFFSDPKIGLLAVALRCKAQCDATESAALDARWTSATTWYSRASQFTERVAQQR